MTEGYLRIAVLDSYQPGDLLIPGLAALHRQYPRLRFSLQGETLAQIEEGLIADRLHFAFVDQIVKSDFLETRKLSTLPFVLVAAPSYVAAHGPLTRVEHVLMADLIDLGEPLPTFGAWVSPLLPTTPGLAGILQNVVPAFVVQDFRAAAALATAEVGIACVPRAWVERELAAGALVELSPTQPPAERPLHLLYRHRRVRQLFESLFLEHLLEASTASGTPP